MINHIHYAVNVTLSHLRSKGSTCTVLQIWCSTVCYSCGMQQRVVSTFDSATSGCRTIKCADNSLKHS